MHNFHSDIENRTTAVYLSINDLVSLIGLSRSMVLRRVADGTLPKPFKIGSRTFWVKNEIMDALTYLETKR